VLLLRLFWLPIGSTAFSLGLDELFSGFFLSLSFAAFSAAFSAFSLAFCYFSASFSSAVFASAFFLGPIMLIFVEM